MRVDNLLDNQVEEKIKKIGSDVEEIKTLQISGGDVITPKVFEYSANQFDFSAIFFGGSTWDMSVNIVFTADHQANPYVFLALDLFNMDGSVLARSGLRTYTARIGDFDYVNVNKEYFEIQIQRDSAQFKAKLYIFASDSGSYILSVTRGNIL